MPVHWHRVDGHTGAVTYLPVCTILTLILAPHLLAGRARAARRGQRPPEAAPRSPKGLYSCRSPKGVAVLLWKKGSQRQVAPGQLPPCPRPPTQRRRSSGRGALREDAKLAVPALPEACHSHQRDGTSCGRCEGHHSNDAAKRAIAPVAALRRAGEGCQRAVAPGATRPD